MKTHNHEDTNNTDISMRKKEVTQLLPMFISLISDKLGIFIHSHQMTEVEKIIHQGCREFGLSPSAFLQKLQESRDDSPPLTFLVSGITIGETYFFRDRRQMDLLQNNLLPVIIKSKRKKNNLGLRIWSAGCSSGEEIYTIAMILRELLPDIASWSLHLLGTDINIDMLKKAVAGHYSEWSMRSIPEKFKKNWFLPDNNGYTLLPDVRDMAEFNYLNLHDDTWPSMLNGTTAMDLILCRNVLIYFNNESTAKLMKKMSSSLAEGGYLLLGASDPVSTRTEGLHFHHTEGMLFSRVPLGQVQPPISATPISKVQQVTAPHIQKKKIVTASTSAASPASPTAIDVNRIQELLHSARWQEIINMTEHLNKEPSRNTFLINARAKAMTSLGQLKEAVQFCRQHIQADADNIDLMLMHSMALAEMNQTMEAEAELRKILYLDHQSVMAHYQLGLLLIRNQKISAGLKSLKNAASIAASKQAGDPVPGFNDLNYGHLTEILARETEIHSFVRSNTNASGKQ